jgi:hypothetical protein
MTRGGHWSPYHQSEGHWDYDGYNRVHKFTPDEESMILKLADRPSYFSKLDGIYRSNPKRWHQMVAAAAILRRT